LRLVQHVGRPRKALRKSHVMKGAKLSISHGLTACLRTPAAGKSGAAKII
jgi:hypothetical protein